MRKAIASLAAAAALVGSSVAVASALTLEPGSVSEVQNNISENSPSVKASAGRKNAVTFVAKGISLKAKTRLDRRKAEIISSKSGRAAVAGKATSKRDGETASEKNKSKKQAVKNKEKNSIKESDIGKIAREAGCQIQNEYPESKVMCSAYAWTYAYRQVKGKARTPGSFWYGGCTWDGGTYSYCSSREGMLKMIKAQLDKNKACVGLLSTSTSSTHYVTFYGYTGSGESLADFKILDPWDGSFKSGSSYGYSNGYDVVTVD